MIHFKCVYCGQRILAKDDGRGKKGNCPKCNHLLTVPESTKAKPAITSVKEPIPNRPKEPPVYDVSDKKDTLTELVKESFGFLVPTYDRLSLFLMAITWILLYVINDQLRQPIQSFLKVNNIRVVLAILVLPVAFLLIGIYQIFIKREESDFEKSMLLWFAIGTNISICIVASVYIFRNTNVSNWELVFPIWNIVNAVILYLMWEIDLLNENCIVERETRPAQIIFGIAAVVIIIFACNYITKLHWSITFSICIVYTTSFDRALQSVFPGFFRDTCDSKNEVET